MALINCPECGKEISDTAKKCIHCGYALTKNTEKKKKLIIGGILIVAIAIIITLVLTLVWNNNKVTEVKLTGDNLEEYFIIDASVEDVDIGATSGLFSIEYTGTATLNVSARLKEDVDFENVVIEGCVYLDGMCWLGTPYTFKLQLDKDGNAEITQHIDANEGEVGNSSLLKPEYPKLSASVTELYANDNDYVSLAMDGQVVITSISGSVYVTE